MNLLTNNSVYFFRYFKCCTNCLHTVKYCQKVGVRDIMASPYPVGHPKYKRKDSDSLDSPSTSKQKSKRDKEDSLETNTCKTVQVTRHLRLRNNTGCCRNHNCQLEDLPCERNLCFSNVTINILDKVEPLKDFFCFKCMEIQPP